MHSHTLTDPTPDTAAVDVYTPGHLGELTHLLPDEMVDAAIDETHSRQKRLRDLPSRVVVYLLIAACLFPDIGYTQVWSKLVARWPTPSGPRPSASGLSQARRRVGPGPLRWLFELLRGPEGATPHRPSVWWKNLLVTGLDGTILTVPDQPGTRTRFVKQAGNHGGTGYPQARLLALVTCGTRTLIDAVFTHTKIGEVTLVPRLQSSMHPGMLVLADRNFDAATVADTIGGTGADFLIRGKGHRRQPVIARHPDGSFTSCIGALPVRIIDASVLITTGGVQETHPYRLITTLIDPVRYPAHQLVALYHERWEIETTFLELKSTLGDGRVLRARTAPGIEQEIYALLIAYQLIRTTISDATYMGGIDPDRGSFTIAFEAAKEQVILAGHHIDDSTIDLVGTIGERVLAAPLPRRRLRVCPRVVKRAISKYQARGVVDRTCRKATFEISIHSGESP